jgi:hypothetical protein
MNRRANESNTTRFSGFAVEDVGRLDLPTNVYREARTLLERILASNSLEQTTQVLALASDTLRLLRQANSLTANQAQDLSTLFHAASFERTGRFQSAVNVAIQGPIGHQAVNDGELPAMKGPGTGTPDFMRGDLSMKDWARRWMILSDGWVGCVVCEGAQPIREGGLAFVHEEDCRHQVAHGERPWLLLRDRLSRLS